MKLFNTATKEKQDFHPIDPDHVRMYACGPTVHDYAHIGNARPVVVFDVLFRLLTLKYPKVTYVRNITDIDDKIINAAKLNNESIQDLTARTYQYYTKDMQALSALKPSVEPFATETIAEMIAMIQALIEKNYAYVVNNQVFFSVETYKNYGSLSRKNTDDLQDAVRVDAIDDKRQPGDFVLWKPSKDSEPGWDSPWGFGRPGWHIECSAMAHKFLGTPFDIHCGGIDLVFPHHENEQAQSCCALNQQTMANFWLHNGHLLVDGKKMSKSLGNFFTVNELLKDSSGEVIRLALLLTHYRQPLDWQTDTLIQAKNILDRMYKAISFADSTEKGSCNEDFLQALDDDLNTPMAIQCLQKLADACFGCTGDNQKQLANNLKASANFIGLLNTSPKQWFQGGIDALDVKDIENLIHQRQVAKNEKNFTTADRIRDQLAKKNILLEDGPNGTTWRHA